MTGEAASPRFRAIFVSDVHLGTRACQAARLLEFLREHESEYLYLVGDIVDFWAMSRSIYWSGEHNTVVQKVLKRARHGTQVVLVPGNHDELLREHLDISFGEIRIVENPVHVSGDGRRYLVTHGDAFDQVTRYHRWIALLGDHGYVFLMRISEWFSWWRRLFGAAGDWSLSGFVKKHLKSALVFIDRFERAVARDARERGFDGVICGHIHAPADKIIDGIRYLNCGDWVDSCTALIETFEGRIELVRWSRTRSRAATSRAEETTPQAA